MAIYTNKNREAWTELSRKLSPNNPLNKKCKVVRGRKYRDVECTVIKLIEDVYYDWSYTTEVSRSFKEMAGRDGYVALCLTDDNTKFWIKSVYLEIL
jgi:hypothetical protein